MNKKVVNLGLVLVGFSAISLGLYQHFGNKTRDYFDWEGYEKISATRAEFNVRSPNGMKNIEIFPVRNAAECLREGEYRMKRVGLDSFITCYDEDERILSAPVDRRVGVAAESSFTGAVKRDYVEGPKKLAPKVVPIGFLNKPKNQ